MKVYYSDLFPFPLPEGHRFPIEKYLRLRERILAAGILSEDRLLVPEAATDGQLLLAHTPSYLGRVKAGTLTQKEIREIGFPWSPRLVERSRRSVGGTIGACRSALETGQGANLAGGTHHASAGRGQGFCVFNDSAVAARVMQVEGRVERVLIVDCDVHQGNGTAAIFAGDDSVFTFSIHGAKNFPFRKVPGDLDIGLPDGVSDDAYLQALEEGLDEVFSSGSADLVIYLAGADPYAGDRLGRLALSKAGLLERDRMVYTACQKRGVPVATVMGGGYAQPIDHTVDIHFATIRTAARFHARQVVSS
jgi:acetoin utilization deacetylase AcuC-like enzyme